MEKSYPWGYQLGADSMVPYTAKEWYAVWNTIARSGGMVIDNGLRTVGDFANMGVFYSVANRLVVTNPGAAANRIAIDTGAAMIDGAFFYNTVSVSSAGNVTSPAANPRIDRVVVRKNYAAASYVPANASAADFTVTTQTARITVIHGAENVAPVAPALTQDTTRATYWDIPLYQYQISVAGAISAITDEREWVDAETKRLLLPAINGWNSSDATGIDNGSGFVTFADAKVCYANVGNFYVPDDFISTGILYGVVIPGATGDLYFKSDARYGACDEAYDTHSDAIADTVYAVTQNTYACIAPMALADLAIGDIVNIAHQRTGDDPLDTIGTWVYYAGALLTYLGWR